MAQFKIEFMDGKTEEVTASGYSTTKDNQWIDFYKRTGGALQQVLRIRAEDVKRIDQVET